MTLYRRKFRNQAGLILASCANHNMKKVICLLLAVALAPGCRTSQAPANPKSNVRAKAILEYFQSLEGRTNKCLLSGQFSNFGPGAGLRLMDEIHDHTGHWPALLGVDYASRGGVNPGAPNQAAIEYWKQGGLVTISTHLYNLFKIKKLVLKPAPYPFIYQPPQFTGAFALIARFWFICFTPILFYQS